MGASTAYHLAARGLTNIVLLEREAYLGQGATGRCAGGVRYQFATEINIQLSRVSLPMLERFPEEIGQEVNYRKCGYLFVLTDEQDIPQFRHNLELQNQLGLGTEWLSGDEIRRRLPSMHFEDALAGTFNPRDGLVDPNSVVLGYSRAALGMGVQVFNQTEVLSIEVENERVAGVGTNSGSIQTRCVINAAGPWASQIGNMAGLQIPVQAIRRQMFTTTALPDLPVDFPFVIDFTQSLYLHREGIGLLIGMSNQKEKAGYDQSVDPEFELVNLEAAARRMPALENVRRASHWAGLYEVTPDAHPIYGPTDVDGFLLVAGFSGHGFMHGPVSGKLMAEYVLDGSFQSVNVAALDLARFAEGRAIQEYNVV